MNPAQHTNGQFQVIQLTGRLTRDPEVIPLESGSQVCHLRLAIESMGRGGETGYVDVSTFGKPGEAAARVLRKGWLVAADARLDYRTWDDDGTTRHAYQVIGNVEFLAAPRAGDTNTADSDAQAATAA